MPVTDSPPPCPRLSRASTSCPDPPPLAGEGREGAARKPVKPGNDTGKSSQGKMLYGLKTPVHSSRSPFSFSDDKPCQSTLISLRLSMPGAYSGSGLLKPVRPDTIASPLTRIVCPCSDKMKSTHSFAAFGCGAFLRMNILCGSSTEPSCGSMNF